MISRAGSAVEGVASLVGAGGGLTVGLFLGLCFGGRARASVAVVSVFFRFSMPSAALSAGEAIEGLFSSPAARASICAVLLFCFSVNAWVLCSIVAISSSFFCT